MVDVALDWLVKEFKSGRSIFIVIITYVISIWIIKKYHQTAGVNSPESRCILKTAPGSNMWDAYVSMCRGDNYFLSDDVKNSDVEAEYKERVNCCVVTAWALLHFFLYAILGFLCPKFYWPLFVVGIGWEFIEYELADCHCVMDIGWNLAGLTVGWILRTKLFPY